MKFCSFVSTVFFLLLAACSSGIAAGPVPAPIDWKAFDRPQVRDAGSSGPTERERAIPEAYIRILEAPENAPLATLLDSNVSMSFPGLVDTRGRASVIQSHEQLFGAFAPRVIRARRIFRTDSVQIIEWTLDGIASRSWMGVANAHGAASFDGITFLSTTDDGTITDVHVYFDVASVKVQLRAASEKLANHPIPKETSASTDIVKAMDTSEETENVAVVRAMLDSLERRDDAAYVRSLADSIEESVPDRALTLHGKDEVRGRTKALIRAISQLDTTIHSANGADRFVVVEYTLSGVLVGPLGFLAPTNRVVTLHVVDVIEMGEGKVISLREYGNFAEVLSSGS